MNNTKYRLITAIAVAIVGLILAGRAIYRVGGGISQNINDEEVSQKNMSIAEEYMRTIDENGYKEYAEGQQVYEDIEEYYDNSSSLPSRLDAQRDRIIDAVVERYQAFVVPDFERDIGRLNARGSSLQVGEMTPEGRDKLVQWLEYHKGSKLNIENMEVRMVCDNGVWLSDTELMRGFGRVMTEVRGPIAPPVPEKPSLTRGDVVEVRIPAIVKTKNDDYNPVILAYMLYFDPSSNIWKPFRSMFYYPPSSKGAYVVPFL